MKTVTVDLLGESSNSPVTRLPGREYPGVVMQGDSLKILLCRIRELRDNLSGSVHTDSPLDLAEELLALLEARMSVYRDALRAHRMDTTFLDDVLDGQKSRE